jgi:hypothetical protein
VPDHPGDAAAHEAEVYQLLQETVRSELEMYAGILDLDLSAENVDTLAWAVATQVAYGFSLRWDPDWVPAREPHLWGEDGRTFARCTLCLAVSPPLDGESSAFGWHDEHQRTEHASEQGKTD